MVEIAGIPFSKKTNWDIHCIIVVATYFMVKIAYHVFISNKRMEYYSCSIYAGACRPIADKASYCALAARYDECLFAYDREGLTEVETLLEMGGYESEFPF